MATTRRGHYLEPPVLGLRLGKTTWGQLTNVQYANDSARTDQVWRTKSRSKLHIISVQCFRAHQPFSVLFGLTDHELRTTVKAGDDA